ncbi:MAG: hypothetical protein ACOX8W_00895 [bacterium]|jgi:hypothetical protein
MDMNIRDMFYSAKDLIALGIGSHNKVYALMNSPEFPSVRIGGRLFVKKDVFWKWINDQSRKRGEAK